MKKNSSVRVVLDTNIILAAQSIHPTSPNVEIWQYIIEGQCTVLHSPGMIDEYKRKFEEKGVFQGSR